MMEKSSQAYPFLSLEDVSLRLNGEILFEGTSWEICSDQHWAVLGKNGSGKSLLVKALCGAVPVVRGRMRYHFYDHLVGKDKKGLPRRHIERVTFDVGETPRRREGSFYQARWNSLANEDALTVPEYLSEERVNRINPFEVRADPPDPAVFRRRRTEVIELLAIQTLLDRKVMQLSNGEMRKILLARALLRNPRMLILDNPFTGLDKDYRVRMKDILSRIMGSELRVVVVTARWDEIPGGITHALLIRKHRVAAKGPLNEVLSGKSAQALTEDEQPEDPGLDFRRIRGEAAEKDACPVLVEMHNVQVAYEGIEILREIDWAIRKGERWALLGPNGSGKTTLLSLILGDNPQAYANDISLFGRRRGSGESIWEIKRLIGYVSPELHAYYPKTLSCFDVVCSGFFDSMGLYRMCSQEQRITASSWIEQLRLEKYSDEPFGGLSEGEQRMILMVRALVKQPLLMVLDEPCQGLDAVNRGRILACIDAAGVYLETGVIYVTHVFDELPEMTTHIIELEGGRVRKKSRVS